MTQEPDTPSTSDATPGDAQGSSSAGAQSPRRLVRATQGEMVGGVALGMANYFNLDPTLVRLGWVLAALLSGGLAVVAYIVAWIVMPEDTGTEASTGRQGGGGWSSAGWGILLIAIGAAVLLSQLDVPAPAWRTVAAGGLILVGLALAFEARRGLNGGLLTLAIVLTVGLTATTGTRLDIQSGFGERRVVVVEAQNLEPTYSHAFGSLRIEVDEAALPAGTTAIDVSIAFGEATIRVPADVGLRVNARTTFGTTQVMGQESSGIATTRVTTSPNYEQAERRIDMTVNTAFGSVRVQR